MFRDMLDLPVMRMLTGLTGAYMVVAGALTILSSIGNTTFGED